MGQQMKRLTGRQHQGGFTLIELVVAIVIIGILSIGIMRGLAQRADAQQQSVAAGHMKTYTDAAYTYIQSNAASIQAAAGPATPVTITTAQLRAAGVLDASFSDVTPYGQTLTTRVLEPTPGKLDPIIMSTGGTPLTDLQVHGIAAKITELGGDGGFIDSRNGGNVIGAGGWWSKAAASYGVAPGAGHVADGLFVRFSATTDDYLHRTANANPALNAMSTDINMQSHSLNNVGTINANLINLPGGNSINIGGSYLYGDGSNLALRSASGGVYFQSMSGVTGSIMTVKNITDDGTGAFTANTLWARSNLTSAGSATVASWLSAGSVTSQGDVTANGASYASNWFRSYGNTGWYSQTYGGGWYMADSTWVRSYADKNVYTGGQIQGGSVQSNSTITAAGRITTGEFVQVNGFANAGWGCAPDGLIARASDGTGLLQCVGGVWVAFGGIQTTTVSGAGACSNGSNQVASIATCPAGYKVTGGGNVLTYYGPIYGGSTSSSATNNSPDASYPSGNSWVVLVGGAAGRSCMAAYAQCAK